MCVSWRLAAGEARQPRHTVALCPHCSNERLKAFHYPQSKVTSSCIPCQGNLLRSERECAETAREGLQSAALGRALVLMYANVWKTTPGMWIHSNMSSMYVNFKNNDATCIVKWTSHMMNHNYKHLALFSWQCKGYWKLCCEIFSWPWKVLRLSCPVQAGRRSTKRWHKATWWYWISCWKPD